MHSLQQGLGWRPAEPAPPLPPVLDTLAASIQIMQVRITRSRMGGDPPEFTIAPRLSHLDVLDFHRAREAIEAGEQAAQDCVALLRGMGLCPEAPATG